MTARERLMAAMRREEVDKVPCSPRLGEALKILYHQPQGDPTELALRAADPAELDLDPHFVTGSGVPAVVAATSGEVGGLVDVRCRRDVRDDGPCLLIERVFETPAGQLRELIREPKPGRLEYGLAPNPIRLEPLVKGSGDLPALACLLPDP
ncbi:MAG: hypothetical protein HUU35_08455, partial [Armatimonadetes bacterium]|nr:hypothetical protein [Armatimonadota bacterium]